VNLYLDLDEDLIDHYDEDTNPGGVRRVLENATRYLDNAVAIWKLLGIEDKAAELSVLLRGLWNVYRIERIPVIRMEPDEVIQLAGLLGGIVEAAERELVDDDWRVHPVWVEQIEQAHPGLGYFTTDGQGERIYSLSMCLSQLNMTVAYLRDAIELGCAVLAE
jgi:hypothetical protein